MQSALGLGPVVVTIRGSACLYVHVTSKYAHVTPAPSGLTSSHKLSLHGRSSSHRSRYAMRPTSFLLFLGFASDSECSHPCMVYHRSGLPVSAPTDKMARVVLLSIAWQTEPPT